MRGWRRSNRFNNEGIHRSIMEQRPDLERLSRDTLVVGCRLTVLIGNQD